MTAQPSSQAEREDVALESLTPEIVAYFSADPCLIWSDEWRLFWRPNGNGYTSNQDEAWHLTLAEAYARTRHCDLSKGIRFVRPDREHATPRSMPEEVVASVEARFPNWRPTPAMRGFAKARVRSMIRQLNRREENCMSNDMTNVTPLRVDWNKHDLAEAYDLIEGVRRAAAQDPENPLDTSLRYALDAVEAADCEWDGLTLPEGAQGGQS